MPHTARVLLLHSLIKARIKETRQLLPEQDLGENRSR